MNLSYKSNFWGYIKFYYRIVGNRLFFYLILSILISLLDGIGLTMFIPLLQFVGNSAGTSASKPMAGSLGTFIDVIEKMGFQLTITTVLAVLILVFVIKGLLKYFQLTYYAKLRQLFIKKIRYYLIDNLKNLSYTGFLQLDAGRIQNTLTSEVQRLFNTMSLYFNAAQSFLMLSTYIILAFLANYQFALLIGCGSVISNLIYRKIFKATEKASIEISKKSSDFNSYLIQAIHYFKYLKSTNAFFKYGKKLTDVIDTTEQLNRKIGDLKAIAYSIKEPVIISIVCIVILLQVLWMGAGLNTIILSLLLFYRALGYLVSVQNEWHGFIENIGGMNAVAVMSENMLELQETDGSEEFKNIQHKIAFKNVGFSYDRIKILKGIDIIIPAKSTVALIGESGVGKTTIANIIAGLIKPCEGEVYIDDIAMSNLRLNNYRNKIGYISQESVVFNDTIYNNITFWADYTPENKRRFDEIALMASLKNFIEELPDKEHTKLGDNGILISGGQKQRISIARELYKDAEILIFDEATSSLDSETEKIIQKNIQLLHGSHTIILIAHRLSTIKEADIIYLLEKGKVSASGSFDEMISTSSRFKKMVALQDV